MHEVAIGYCAFEQHLCTKAYITIMQIRSKKMARLCLRKKHMAKQNTSFLTIRTNTHGSATSARFFPSHEHFPSRRARVSVRFAINTPSTTSTTTEQSSVESGWVVCWCWRWSIAFCLYPSTGVCVCERERETVHLSRDVSSAKRTASKGEESKLSLATKQGTEEAL